MAREKEGKEYQHLGQELGGLSALASFFHKDRRNFIIATAKIAFRFIITKILPLYHII